MHAGWRYLIIVLSLCIIVPLFMRYFARNSAQQVSQEFCRGFQQGDLDNLVQRNVIAKQVQLQMMQSGIVFTARPDEKGVEAETRLCSVESVDCDTFGLEWSSIVNLREYGPNTPDASYRLGFTGHGRKAEDCRPLITKSAD